MSSGPRWQPWRRWAWACSGLQFFASVSRWTSLQVKRAGAHSVLWRASSSPHPRGMPDSIRAVYEGVKGEIAAFGRRGYKAVNFNSEDHGKAPAFAGPERQGALR